MLKTNWLNNKTVTVSFFPKILSKQNKNKIQRNPPQNKINIKNRNKEGRRGNISGKHDSFVELRHLYIYLNFMLYNRFT